MLLSREEMAFDFGGAKLDPVADKDVIVWSVQQFLYGEMTGIQIGHWIYNAPDLESARFLSRQAVEEFQHVGNFLRILTILRAKPEKAAGPVRFLATGLMGGDWAEHVAMEMALGEGLVLQAFYAMIDTVDEPEIVAILKRGVKQEERHVEFGEQQTTKAIQGKPWLRRRLLGLALVTLWGVGRLESLMKSRLPMEHPALKLLPALVRHSVKMAELRLTRIGVDRSAALVDVGGAQARLRARGLPRQAARRAPRLRALDRALPAPAARLVQAEAAHRHLPRRPAGARQPDRRAD